MAYFSNVCDEIYNCISYIVMYVMKYIIVYRIVYLTLLYINPLKIKYTLIIFLEQYRGYKQNKTNNDYIYV